MFGYYLIEARKALKIITPTYYLVTENPKKGLFSKTPLSYVDCSEVRFKGEKIKYGDHCIKFHESTMIGRSEKDGSNSYVEAELHPCLQDCDFYPSDPDYWARLIDSFYWVLTSVNFLDSSSHYDEFENSIEQLISNNYDIYLDPFKTIISSIVLKQEVI